MMSLTGNLDVFPLDEVLRLLARSEKTGRLAVEAPGTTGRVFVEGGALLLATVVDDEELVRRLEKAGVVDAAGIRRVETGDHRLDGALAPGVSAAVLTDYVREHVVESLYRIGHDGVTFVFHVDEGPRYHPAQRFDVEVAMADAERRAQEWAEIGSVLPGIDVPVRMVPRLRDEGDVTLSPAGWEVLARLDGGTSVLDLSDRLGLSAFRVAREVAGLLRRGLLETVGGQAVPAVSREEAPGVDAVPELPTVPVEHAAPDAGQAAPPEAGEASAESWWSDPSTDPRPADQGDRFLASVFSQLDEEEADDEGGFAMGALRRRLDALHTEQDDRQD